MKWLVTFGKRDSEIYVPIWSTEVETEFRHDAIRIALSKNFKTEYESIPYQLWVDAVDKGKNGT